MKIGKFEKYKNYTGTIEYDLVDKIYFGELLDISDIVGYHAENLRNLYDSYCLAIEDYIEFKNKGEVK